MCQQGLLRRLHRKEGAHQRSDATLQLWLSWWVRTRIGTIIVQDDEGITHLCTVWAAYWYMSVGSGSLWPVPFLAVFAGQIHAWGLFVEALTLLLERSCRKVRVLVTASVLGALSRLMRLKGSSLKACPFLSLINCLHLEACFSWLQRNGMQCSFLLA